MRLEVIEAIANPVAIYTRATKGSCLPYLRLTRASSWLPSTVSRSRMVLSLPLFSRVA
jgi:hypothetical protein